MAETPYNFDNLFAGDYYVVSETVTILSGENLERGTVLGKVTATGKMKIVNSANSDGSENPYAVLSDDVDASAADVVSAAYLSGEYNENKLIVGGTDTVAQHKAAMRLLGMYQKPSLTTTGQNS